MPTMNSVIAYVDSIRPNAYDEAFKCAHISKLDGIISKEVMQYDEAITYSIPEDADTELLVQAPYDDIYSLYVMAMIDFANKEYGSYNNAMRMFNDRFESFKKDYIRSNLPPSAENFRNVMG